MNTKEQKLDYILKEIRATRTDILGFNSYLNKAKKELEQDYIEKQDRLVNFPKEKILAFPFGSQVISRAEKLEQKALAKKLIREKFIGLEVHTYAPELNKAIFKRKNELTKIPSINCNYTFAIDTYSVKNKSELLIYLSNKKRNELQKFLDL